MITSGITSGEFRISDSRIAALAIGGMVSWAYVWYRPNGRLTLDQVATEMSDLILSMVGIDPTAPPDATKAKRARARAS